MCCPVQWDGFSSGCAAPRCPMARCVMQGFSGSGARMPARSVCLVALSLSETGPGRFGRQVSVMDICHAMPCHATSVPTLIHVMSPQPAWPTGKDTTGHWSPHARPHVHSHRTPRTPQATGRPTLSPPLSPPLSPFLPPPPAPSVLARHFNGVPSENLLPRTARVASGVRCVHSAWPPSSVDHGPST